MTKYRSRKTEAHGIVFDSAKEARRYGELLLLQRAGKISHLERQVPYTLAPGVTLAGEKRARPAIRYVVDFRYKRGDDWVFEDTKGMDTPMSRLKRHLMATVHGIFVELS